MGGGMIPQDHGKQTLSQFTGYGFSQPNSKFHENFPGCEGNGWYRGSLQKVNTVGIQYPNQQERITGFAPNQRCVMHFSRVPKHGDVFYSRRIDNVLLLDYVSKGESVELHGLEGGDLYRIHEENGVPTLRRMGGDILTVYEERKTATYYLPDKDIALHFTSVPKEGGIFCCQRNDNVLILETLPMETSQEHHNMQPQDMELYRVQKELTGFLLLKMDDSKSALEEIYPICAARLDDNSTFTCYLHDKEMVLHFNRLPTHGDIFTSYRKKNIMLLDVCPEVNYKVCHSPLRSYGSPLDTDIYRVQQTDDGFQLVKVTYSENCGTPEDLIRRELNIRRHIASNTSSDEDNKCALCLAAYKDFDRIGTIECGHEYHVSCIIPFIRQNSCCPICKKKVMVEILELPEASFKT